MLLRTHAMNLTTPLLTGSPAGLATRGLVSTPALYSYGGMQREPNGSQRIRLAFQVATGDKPAIGTTYGAVRVDRSETVNPGNVATATSAYVEVSASGVAEPDFALGQGINAAQVETLLGATDFALMPAAVGPYRP
jgi:hypothetical protein